jgi:hypothetical protein
MEAEGRHLGEMEAQLKAWGRRLEEYAATADKAVGETRAAVSKHVVELKTTFKAAQERLDRLRSEGIDRRDLVMHGLQGAWTEVETTIKQLKG